MNDSLEDLIRTVPLRSPSPECDQKVMETLRSPVHQKSVSRGGNVGLWIMATAASLLIGFVLGSMTGLGRGEPDPANTRFTQNAGLAMETNQEQKGSLLRDGVQLLDDDSRTVVLHESLHWQNKRPVRKIETLTTKKVRLKNENGKPAREIEVPIRRVTFRPAESI